MSNITLSLDDKIIKAGREYAKQHNTSLNALVRKLLEETVGESSELWQEECFAVMDKAGGKSTGKKWKREDLYDV